MLNRRAFLRHASQLGGSVALAASRLSWAQVRPTRTLVGALADDPLNFDPTQTVGPSGREATRALFDPLVNVDAAGRIVPGLATEWERPDARTYILHLRRGVRFHDGTTFEADAVKAHFDYHLNPSNPNNRRTEVSSIDSVVVVDSHTVRVSLKEPFSAFLAPLFDCSGFIESPTTRRQYGPDFGLHPVGTGPFKLVEYRKDVQAVLERNPDYWQPDLPKVDRLVLRPIPVGSTRVTELRTGRVHVAADPAFQDLPRLRTDSQVVLSEKPGFRWDYMGFNPEREPGNNKLFRQAFNWAIDREAIHRVAWGGTGSVGFAPYLPGTPFYDPAYRPFRRDLDKARELLRASGVRTPLTLETSVTQDLVKQQVAQIVQQNLADLDIHLTLKQMDAAAQLARLKAADFVFEVTWFWIGYRPDPDQMVVVSVQSKGAFNLGHASNPVVDQAIEQERATTNEDERRRAFRRLAEALSEDAVYLTYHHGSAFTLLRPEVRGFVHRQDGLTRYHELGLA